VRQRRRSGVSCRVSSVVTCRLSLIRSLSLPALPDVDTLRCPALIWRLEPLGTAAANERDADSDGSV